MQKMILLPYERYQRLLSAKQEIPSTSTVDDSLQQQEKSSEEVTPICLERTENPPEKQLSHKEDIERLITLFPKTLQGRTRALLTYILPYITWNQKGEVIISGEKIPNSNIVDLIKVQLNDYRDFRPFGVEKFDILLKDVNVPLSLLTNSKRQQRGEGNIPPPPGIPVKRKDENPKKLKAKWLKL